MSGKCKQHMRIRVEWQSGSRVVDAWLHPRGCMRARYTHLDLEPVKPLSDLAARRGLTLRCRNTANGIEVTEPLTGIGARLKPLSGIVLRCGGRQVYVMRTRSGLVYIAPVAAPPGETRRSTPQRRRRS